MSDGAGAGMPAALQWVAGVGVTVSVAVIGLFAAALNGVRGHIDAEVSALWTRLNAVSDGNANHRAEAASTFATRADLEGLREWIEKRMELHERRMGEMIANRRGIKS